MPIEMPHLSYGFKFIPLQPINSPYVAMAHGEFDKCER